MHSTLTIRSNTDGSTVVTETNPPGDRTFILASDVSSSPQLRRIGRFIVVTTDNPRMYQIIDLELSDEGAAYVCTRVRG
jgi:hypothetical protein